MSHLGFTSKLALEQETRLMISAASIGRVKPDTRLHRHLKALVGRHPTIGKFNNNVIGFRIIRGNATIAILEGGGEELFSWVKCCTQRRTTERQRLSDLMREAIGDTTRAFRATQPVPHRCVKCGYVGKCEVDHVYPFSKLMADYFAENPEEEFRPNLVTWKTFHDERATFQMLCAPCNNNKSNT